MKVKPYKLVSNKQMIYLYTFIFIISYLVYVYFHQAEDNLIDFTL